MTVSTLHRLVVSAALVALPLQPAALAQELTEPLLKLTAAREAGLPERGSAFRALLENCALTRKPDQVLGAIHYLRNVEGISDSPPRVVNELFSDAGIDPPGNLSLYLNRLKERRFLEVPTGKDDKNRFAILTPEGQAHLDKRSNA